MLTSSNRKSNSAFEYWYIKQKNSEQHFLRELLGRSKLASLPQVGAKTNELITK